MYQLGIISLIRVTARYGPDIIGSVALIFSSRLFIHKSTNSATMGLVDNDIHACSTSCKPLTMVASLACAIGIPGHVASTVSSLTAPWAWH